MTFCVRLGWEAISNLKIAASLAKPKIKFCLTRQPSTLLTAKRLLKPAWSCSTACKHQKAPARGALRTLTWYALACLSPCLRRLSNELIAQGRSSSGLPNSDNTLISGAFFIRLFKQAYLTAWLCVEKRSSAWRRSPGVCGSLSNHQLLGEQIALVCSICWFPWCEHSHCDWFLVHFQLNINLKIEQCAVRSRGEQTPPPRVNLGPF